MTQSEEKTFVKLSKTVISQSRSKVKARRRRREKVQSTECSEATLQHQLTSAEWIEVEAHQVGTEDEWPSTEDLRPSKWQPLVVPMDGQLAEGKEMEDETETKSLDQRLRPSDQSQVSLAEDLRPSGSLVEEPKTAEFGLADLLSDRIILLVKYLDGKMVKYLVLECATSYVELVRKSIKMKVEAIAKVAERAANFTSKCATMTVTLQEIEAQLQAKESECIDFWRKLAVENSLCTQIKLECKDIRVDIGNAQKVTVELRDRLKLSRTGFEKVSRCVEELTSTLTARDQAESVYFYYGRSS
ncbi:hypothetical protein AXG93_3348s1120 [Marchantia polymorpha subsp. ruderalis]|uniref:Uncharacterized protein n=1 Tax=Marchantia polymorpha subsp. ruderalis TaxID=1480154 RepID=A0A176VNF9_MARPO|nr:hypothetical protein AXG93_3348s1120 [Marchantia polymorpha subsp. ruderalis]